MDYAKLDALIEARRDEFLKDLGRWLSIPSVKGAAEEGAPFGRENRRMLDLALEDARGYGFDTRMFDGYAGDISMGNGEKTLGILCHLDVVPAGDGWTVEPFALTQKDGNLIGRGVLDDKGPALAALYAMRCVRDAGVELKDTVRLILGCDEETGMTDMAYYNAHTASPDYGFSPDAEYPVINIEKGGLQRAAFQKHRRGRGRGDPRLRALRRRAPQRGARPRPRRGRLQGRFRPARAPGADRRRARL